MRSPYKGRFKVTQQFKGNIHDGLDLVGLDGKEIYSTVNGRVRSFIRASGQSRRQS